MIFTLWDRKRGSTYVPPIWDFSSIYHIQHNVLLHCQYRHINVKNGTHQVGDYSNAIT
jgi:hypothetical protein